MFMYYGSKGNVIDCYPAPKYNRIIEPFAGSARYSLKHWKNDITIIDKYSVIADVWKYLQKSTEKDILNLPKLKSGECINDFDLTDIEKKFLGFMIFVSGTTPTKKMTKFNGLVQNQHLSLRRIAKQLYKIRHWEIVEGDYDNYPNEEATWFIDPPYQFGGEHYKENNKKIDFVYLANWCKSRKGQVIVCENTKATWMEFKPMKEMSGTVHKTIEAIWTNYDRQMQPKLFK